MNKASAFCAEIIFEILVALTANYCSLYQLFTFSDISYTALALLCSNLLPPFACDDLQTYLPTLFEKL